jgi:hypothetical protein
MRATFAFVCLFVLSESAFAQQPPDQQTVSVGPWTIATTYKVDKFENCTMTRSVDNLGAVFVRNHEGLLLSLDSPKWRLERGKAYPIRISAGQRAVETKALAEPKSVTITLADAGFNERLRTSNVLEVRGEGAMIRVPLDGSAAGLERLDLCFEKNVRQSSESNPFVAPVRRP